MSVRDDLWAEALCGPGDLDVRYIPMQEKCECEYCGSWIDGDKCKNCGAPRPFHLPPGILVLNGVTAKQWEQTSAELRARQFGRSLKEAFATIAVLSS